MKKINDLRSIEAGIGYLGFRKIPVRYSNGVLKTATVSLSGIFSDIDLTLVKTTAMPIFNDGEGYFPYAFYLPLTLKIGSRTFDFSWLYTDEDNTPV